MKRLVCLMLFAMLVSAGKVRAEAHADAIQTRAKATLPMSNETAIRDLFDRWEKVWNRGESNLVPSCVGNTYIRHDENGDRTVTREAYTAEIAQIKIERPDIQVVVYDHGFQADRAWFRFAFKWTDLKTGEPRSRAGMQSYRIEGGKLAETWLAMQPLGSAWTDAPQAHWTSAPSIN